MVDVYDTVLRAIGRQADTDNLSLDNVNVKINPRNKKILATCEQTSCPNIYAIGDVMEVRDFFSAFNFLLDYFSHVSCVFNHSFQRTHSLLF